MFFSLFQGDFISKCIMIQGLGVGTIMYSGPLYYLERRIEDRRQRGQAERGVRSDLPRKCASVQAETQDLGQRASVYTHRQRCHPLSHELPSRGSGSPGSSTSSSWSGFGLELAVIRSSLVLLDFSLNLFSHGAHS